MEAIEGLAQSMPVSQACAVLGFARSSLYRSRQAVGVCPHVLQPMNRALGGSVSRWYSAKEPHQGPMQWSAPYSALPA